MMIVLMEEILYLLVWSVSQDLYISGGAGFLPSTSWVVDPSVLPRDLFYIDTIETPPLCVTDT